MVPQPMQQLNYWWDSYFAVRAAAVDILSPGTLTGVLLFVVIVYALARSRRATHKLWGYFLTGAILLKILSDFGLFDVQISARDFNRMMDAVYLPLASGFLFLGFVAYRDWRIIRKTKDDARTVIRLSMVLGATPRPRTTFWEKGAVAALGGVVAFIQSGWLQGSDAVQIADKLLQSKFELLTVTPYALYLVIFLLPLWAVWWGIRNGLGYGKESLPQVPYSKIYIIAAAIFLGYGSAILTYFL